MKELGEPKYSFESPASLDDMDAMNMEMVDSKAEQDHINEYMETLNDEEKANFQYMLDTKEQFPHAFTSCVNDSGEMYIVLNGSTQTEKDGGFVMTFSKFGQEIFHIRYDDKLNLSDEQKKSIIEEVRKGNIILTPDVIGENKDPYNHTAELSYADNYLESQKDSIENIELPQMGSNYFRDSVDKYKFSDSFDEARFQQIEIENIKKERNEKFDVWKANIDRLPEKEQQNYKNMQELLRKYPKSFKEYVNNEGEPYLVETQNINYGKRPEVFSQYGITAYTPDKKMSIHHWDEVIIKKWNEILNGEKIITPFVDKNDNRKVKAKLTFSDTGKELPGKFDILYHKEYDDIGNTWFGRTMQPVVLDDNGDEIIE